MQFQVGIYHEKIQLDQIQNGRPAATFDLNILNNWKTLPDIQTITIEQKVRFQVGIYCEKCQFDQIQDGRPAATFDFNNWKIVPGRY